MKFIVPRLEFMQAIKKIQNVVPQNPPIPILSHVLIEANKEGLVMTATDLTVGIRCVSKAKVIEEGAISVPSKRLFQLIKELTDTQVNVAVEDGLNLDIKCGTSKFRLHGMSQEEYPKLPDFSQTQKFSITSKELKEMFFKTSFAVSKEDNRYVLTGVLMRIWEQKAIFVGTDGKRLSKAIMDIDIDPEFEKEFIFPIKAVDEMTKLLDEKEEVTLYLADDKVAIEYDSVTLISKLLSGDFPDFEQIINTESALKVSIHREELTTLLRQIALFTAEMSHSVKFSFRPGELLLTANSSEIGEGQVSMPVDYQGESLDIAFNPHYFLDILRHTKDETICLGLSDPFNPGMITDSQNTLFVLMPMRLHQEA